METTRKKINDLLMTSETPNILLAWDMMKTSQMTEREFFEQWLWKDCEDEMVEDRIGDYCFTVEWDIVDRDKGCVLTYLSVENKGQRIMNYQLEWEDEDAATAILDAALRDVVGMFNGSDERIEKVQQVIDDNEDAFDKAVVKYHRQIVDEKWDVLCYYMKKAIKSCSVVTG